MRSDAYFQNQRRALAEQVLKNGAEIVNIIVGDGVGVKPTVDFKAPFQFFGTPVLRIRLRYRMRGTVSGIISWRTSCQSLF